MSPGSQRPPHCLCHWVSTAHAWQPGLCTLSHRHPSRKAPRSLAWGGFAARCSCMHPLEEKSTSFLSLTGAVFLYIKPEYHRPRRGRHIPGGPGAAGFGLERRGGERHGAVVGQPVSAAERGRSLPGAQEFSLLAGVDGGVHVVRVVPWLVPARLVGGFRHDGLVTLAGHQRAAENKQKQDWASCGDRLLEGRRATPAGSCFLSQQRPKQNGALHKAGFKPF